MNTLFANDAPPAAYVVLHRPPCGGRWIELGKAASMRQALDLVTGKGGFWVRELRDGAEKPTTAGKVSGEVSERKEGPSYRE